VALERWARTSIRDHGPPRPGISVVVCAYNEAATIDECLAATTRLD
jgi:cellulose synthase/poly-beta-1,6-N-acetylglucosamine synthase-like glycosyltransferase